MGDSPFSPSRAVKEIIGDEGKRDRQTNKSVQSRFEIQVDFKFSLHFS